jgi:hypothetical protein
MARHTLLMGWATGMVIATLTASAARAQSAPPIPNGTGTVAFEGTVDREYKIANAVAIKAVDGTRRVFKLAKGLVVHGTADAGAEVLNGLHAGTTVVVHYAGAGTDATAEEVDVLGDGGLRVTEGVITAVDRGRREITVRVDSSTTETLQLTERAAHEVESGAGTTGRVVVYYKDDHDHKVVHHFRKVK